MASGASCSSNSPCWEGKNMHQKVLGLNKETSRQVCCLCSRMSTYWTWGNAYDVFGIKLAKSEEIIFHANSMTNLVMF